MNPIGVESGVPRQHDRLAAGQGSADRLEGLAAHDHGFAPSEIAKAPEIRLQAPEEPVVPSDHTVICGGNDENE